MKQPLQFGATPLRVLSLELTGMPPLHDQARLPYGTAGIMPIYGLDHFQFENQDTTNPLFNGRYIINKEANLAQKAGYFLTPGAPVPSLAIYGGWQKRRTAFVMRVIVDIANHGEHYLTLSGWTDTAFGPLEQLDINSEKFLDMVFNVNTILRLAPIEGVETDSGGRIWEVVENDQILADRDHPHKGARLPDDAAFMNRPMDVFARQSTMTVFEGSPKLTDMRTLLSPARPIRTRRDYTCPIAHVTAVLEAGRLAFDEARIHDRDHMERSIAAWNMLADPWMGPFEKLISIARGDWHTGSVSAGTMAGMGKHMWENAEITYKAQPDDTGIGELYSQWKDDCISTRLASLAVQSVTMHALRNGFSGGDFIFTPEDPVSVNHLARLETPGDFVVDLKHMTAQTGGLPARQNAAALFGAMDLELKPYLRLKDFEDPNMRVEVNLNAFGLSKIKVSSRYGTNVYQYASFADALMSPLLQPDVEAAVKMAKDYDDVLEARYGSKIDPA